METRDRNQKILIQFPEISPYTSKPFIGDRRETKFTGIGLLNPSNCYRYEKSASSQFNWLSWRNRPSTDCLQCSPGCSQRSSLLY